MYAPLNTKWDCNHWTRAHQLKKQSMSLGDAIVNTQQKINDIHNSISIHVYVHHLYFNTPVAKNTLSDCSQIVPNSFWDYELKEAI